MWIIIIIGIFWGLLAGILEGLERRKLMKEMYTEEERKEIATRKAANAAKIGLGLAAFPILTIFHTTKRHK